MYSTPEEIKAAVDAYRSHIAGHNRRILEVYIPFVATAELDPDMIEDDENINEIRIDCLRTLLGHEIKDLISEPMEVLTRYDELVRKLDLDGTGRLFGITNEEYAPIKEKYFASLERALKRKAVEEVRDTIAVPEEFRILADYVYELTGPGLSPELKSRYQAIFWFGVPYVPRDSEHFPKGVTDEYVEKDVKTAEEITECAGIHPSWECAGGWLPGGGLDCYFCIVYCRKIAEPGQEPEPWAWRYISSNADDGECIFDTIPELLAWYCRHRERIVPEECGLTEEDALSGMAW